MTTLLEAMKKAGLVTEKQARATESTKGKYEKKQQRHKQWLERSYKNRFNDVALFEIWEKSGQLPPNSMKKCCLCGKPIFEIIPWKTSHGKTLRICPECFVHGRNAKDPLFPPLEAKPVAEGR